MMSQCACCAHYELCSFLNCSLIEELELKQENSFAGEIFVYDTGRSIPQYFRSKDKQDELYSLNLFQIILYMFRID